MLSPPVSAIIATVYLNFLSFSLVLSGSMAMGMAMPMAIV